MTNTGQIQVCPLATAISERSEEVHGKEKIAALLDRFPRYQAEGYAWYVYRLFHPTEASSIPFLDGGMTPYFPMVTVTARDSRGRERQVRKPKFLNYMFVLALEGQVESLYRGKHRLQPLLKRKPRFDVGRETDKLSTSGHGDSGRPDKWLTVPFSQMRTLIRFTEAHDDTVSLVMADDELLEKGDRVRVIDGPMKGMEGILRTSQGRRGGTVFFTITDMLTTDSSGKEVSVPYVGLESLHISDSQIKVIAFNSKTNHLYKKIQSFEKVLDAALSRRDDLFRDEKLLGKLRLFLQRYDEVRDTSRIYTTKLSMVCYVAARLLNDRTAARRYEGQLPAAAQLSASMQEYVETWRRKLSAATI